MVDTSSTMMPLNSPAPQFSLIDVTGGQEVRSTDFEGSRGLLVMFLSRHCPFVKHVQRKVAELCNSYLDRGLGVVAICANDVERYPGDSPDNLREQAAELGFRFPYLHDESQECARAYRAACTPDFFLFDGRLRLTYRGQFDSSRPGNDIEVSGEDLNAAVDAVLAGRAGPADQRPSMGCNIKWKPGNEPEYFLT
ncbi:MAG: thioredoxin family protein [Trueperaceae bacterium]